MQSQQLRVGVLASASGADVDADRTSVVAALTGAQCTAVALTVDAETVSRLRDQRIDRAFLIGPGLGACDGTLQGALELLGIAYTGSGVLASALAADRLRAKDLFCYRNLSTPPGYAVSALQAADRAEVAALHRSFAFPAVVKARSGRSAMGATVVSDLDHLHSALAQVTAHARCALVERWVKGRDVAVAVIDGRVLGVVERSTAEGTTGRRSYAPAQLPSVRQANLAHIARAAYSALGCRGTACVNFVCADDENDAVLAVDTLPTLDESGALRVAASAAGLGLGELCQAILATARTDSR